jgi:hypothetical protein
MLAALTQLTKHMAPTPVPTSVLLAGQLAQQFA